MTKILPIDGFSFFVVVLSLLSGRTLQQGFGCEPSDECYELGGDILTNLTLGRWTFVRFETNTTLQLHYQVELQFNAEKKQVADDDGTIVDVTDLTGAEVNQTEFTSINFDRVLIPPACNAAKKTKEKASRGATRNIKSSPSSSPSSHWQIAFVSGICVGSELGPNGECPSPKRRQSIINSAVCKCSQDVAKWCPSWRIDNQTVASTRSVTGEAPESGFPQDQDPLQASHESDPHPVALTRGVEIRSAKFLVLGKSAVRKDVLHDAPKGDWYVGIYVMRMPNTTAQAITSNSTLTWKITGSEINSASALLSRPFLPMFLAALLVLSFLHDSASK